MTGIPERSLAAAPVFPGAFAPAAVARLQRTRIRGSLARTRLDLTPTLDGPRKWPVRLTPFGYKQLPEYDEHRQSSGPVRWLSATILSRGRSAEPRRGLRLRPC